MLSLMDKQAAAVYMKQAPEPKEVPEDAAETYEAGKLVPLALVDALRLSKPLLHRWLRTQRSVCVPAGLPAHQACSIFAATVAASSVTQLSLEGSAANFLGMPCRSCGVGRMAMLRKVHCGSCRSHTEVES
jgi:hypothetical protein